MSGPLHHPPRALGLTQYTYRKDSMVVGPEELGYVSRQYLDGTNGGDDLLTAVMDVTRRNVEIGVFCDVCTDVHSRELVVIPNASNANLMDNPSNQALIQFLKRVGTEATYSHPMVDT